MSPKDQKVLKLIIVSCLTALNIAYLLFYSCISSIGANNQGEIAVAIDNTEHKQIDIYHADGTYKKSISLKTSGEIGMYIQDNEICVLLYRRNMIQKYNFNGDLLSEEEQDDMQYCAKNRSVETNGVIYKQRLIFGVDTIYRTESGISKNILNNMWGIFIEKIAVIEMLYLVFLIGVLSIDFNAFRKQSEEDRISQE